MRPAAGWPGSAAWASGCPAPGAPGRARRPRLRPGSRSAVSESAPAPRSAPRAPRLLLPGKWREAARSPCPPRGGSPTARGPGGLSAGWSWRGDGWRHPRGRTGRTRRGALGSAAAAEERGRRAAGRLRPDRVAAPAPPGPRPRSRSPRGAGRGSRLGRPKRSRVGSGAPVLRSSARPQARPPRGPPLLPAPPRPPGEREAGSDRQRGRRTRAGRFLACCAKSSL